MLALRAKTVGVTFRSINMPPGVLSSGRETGYLADGSVGLFSVYYPRVDLTEWMACALDLECNVDEVLVGEPIRFP